MTRALSSAVLVVVLACGSSGTSELESGPPGPSGGQDGGTGSSVDGSAFTNGDARATTGSPEVCNGVDDDHDGLIDNVDVGHDGVCDCLKIATLGAVGTAGVGNVFAAWLSARSTAGAVNLGSQTLTPALLAPYQVIVAQDVHAIGHDYAPEEVKALADWIAAGGGFMTLTGYSDSSEVVNVNRLLAPHGIQYGSTPILFVGGYTVPVTGWVPHPVTQGISKIGVDNGYAVTGGGTVLATEQGFDVLRVADSGKGHVLVWGDEWITYDSEWTGHPDYQVQLFWVNVIKWLTTAAQCQVPIPPDLK
ncbi:MAG: hypothetical protein U0235_18110 [Polyangiaceae bacterium]